MATETKTTAPAHVTLTDSSGKTVAVNVGDWLEIDDETAGSYDRGEVLAVEPGWVSVGWSGAADCTHHRADELAHTVIVHTGKPTPWAYDWPVYEDDYIDDDYDAADLDWC